MRKTTYAGTALSVIATAGILLLALSSCVPVISGQPDNPADDTPVMPPNDDGDTDDTDDINGDDANGDDANGDDTSDDTTGPLIVNFTPRVIDDTILQGESVRTGDIDNDGDTDIVMASSLLDAVILYLNNDDGQTFTRINVSGNGQLVATDIAISDVDGDGDRDIAAIAQFDRAAGAGSPGSVILFRNPGDPSGTWSFVPLTESNIAAPTVIAAADLTGDGRDELIVGTASGAGAVTGLFYLLNLGTTFDQPISIDANTGNITALATHDVDNDSVTDVIAVDRSANEIRWYRNFRTPGETAVPSFAGFLIAPVTAPNDIALGQFDNDADLELLAATADVSGGMILLFDPPVNPQADWTRSTIDPAFGFGQNSRVAAADFNQDGVTDIAAISNELGQLKIYSASRNGFTPSAPIQMFGVFDIAAANITPDQRPDLITTTFNAATFDTVTLFQNTP